MTPPNSTLLALSPESLASMLMEPAGVSLLHDLFEALPAAMALLRVEEGQAVMLVSNLRARRRYVVDAEPPMAGPERLELHLAERLWRDRSLQKVVLGRSGVSTYVLVHGVEPCGSERLEHLAETARLSRRQRTILDHVVRGAANKTIACELDIGESTVEAHMTQILRRVGVTSRAELIALALRK